MKLEDYQVANYTYNGQEYPIVHVPSQHYFKLDINGHQARLSYAEKDNVWNMYRAYTPPALREMGIGAAITTAGLEEARKLRKQVIPSCSYVSWFVSESNGAYDDLI